jgi:hypothetical protein
LGGEPTSGIPSSTVSGITARIEGNPVQGATVSIRLEVGTPLPLQIRLIDIQGVERVAKNVGIVPEGGHTISLDISGISSGEYFVILDWPGGVTQTLPLVVAR